jgi:type II secretory pathway pseudopilin PulG
MQMVERRGAARINLLIVLGLFGLAALVLLLVLLQPSPDDAMRKFMQALASHDVDTLTEMSYLEHPHAPIREQWDLCVNHLAKNYVFLWSYEGLRQPTPDEAVVRMNFTEFLGPEPHQTDSFEVPLVKKDGIWKVDLASLTRKFFPGLPY